MATAPKELDFKAELADGFNRTGMRFKDFYSRLNYVAYTRGWEAPGMMSVNHWVNGKYLPTGLDVLLMIETLNECLRDAGQQELPYRFSFQPAPPPRKRSAAKKTSSSRGKRKTNFLYPQPPSDQELLVA